MVSTEEPEKSGGFGENVSRAIEGILTALVIISSLLTTVISPYYTISVTVILVVLLVVFLIMKDKRATERYKAKLQQQLEIERSRQWNEGTLKITQQTAEQASIRGAKFAMCEAIITAFQESAKDAGLSKEEREFYEKAIKRLKDMEQTVVQIW
jgi:hypothetical protein